MAGVIGTEEPWQEKAGDFPKEASTWENGAVGPRVAEPIMVGSLSLVFHSVL